MNINKDRLRKATDMVAEDLVVAARHSLAAKGFSFIAEYHVDAGGFVRTVKTNIKPAQISRRVDR